MKSAASTRAGARKGRSRYSGGDLDPLDLGSMAIPAGYGRTRYAARRRLPMSSVGCRFFTYFVRLFDPDELAIQDDVENRYPGRAKFSHLRAQDWDPQKEASLHAVRLASGEAIHMARFAKAEGLWDGGEISLSKEDLIRRYADTKQISLDRAQKLLEELLQAEAALVDSGGHTHTLKIVCKA